MSDFRVLSPTMLASPQIGPAEVAEAADQGVSLVINNRPDGESPDEPQGPEIEAAARAAGLDYLAIPIGSAITRGAPHHGDDLLPVHGRVACACNPASESEFH